MQIAIKQNLKLTLPILLTRLLGIASNFIVMILMAKQGAVALSASALIMSIFSVCILLILSFSFSVCALIAESANKNLYSVVGDIFRNALLLNTLLALPILGVFYWIGICLNAMHQPAAVTSLVADYFRGFIFGFIPMLWAAIVEQLLIGIGKPKYIVYLSILSLGVTPFLTWLLIFGGLGLPAKGMLGAGCAISLSAWLSLFFLLGVMKLKGLNRKYHLFERKLFDLKLIKKLYQIGWPQALQFGSEFIAYTFITILMGWMGVVALAAQQILMQFTSIVVMIPTSISQATSVLVAQVRSEKAINEQVLTALGLTSFFMFSVGIVYIFLPETLIQIYLQPSSNAYSQIFSLTKTLLVISAIQQCFDGIRNVLAGAFRGLHETKIPMVVGTFALWMCSLPIAYLLGIVFNKGPVGIRMGLALGIIGASAMLTFTWFRKRPLAPAFAWRP